MAYENVDEIKKPIDTAAMDAIMRFYNHSANQVHKIPSVGVNNRFVYSPKTVYIKDWSNSAVGLLDKAPIIPYTFDKFAAYASLRDYQKVAIASPIYFGSTTSLSGTAADYKLLYANESPPYFRDPFVNGARGCDLDSYVTDVENYALGTTSTQQRSNTLCPIYLFNNDNSVWETDNVGLDLGMKCATVHILKKLDWSGTATEYNSKIQYTLSGSYDPLYLPSTIDSIYDIMAMENVTGGDINLPPLSTAVQEYTIKPLTLPNDNILDFRVSFEPVRQGSNSTQMNIQAEMPLEVAFSNLTPLSVEFFIPVHTYNFYYDKNRNGVYRNRSRNTLNRNTDDESIALGWTSNRTINKLFYDFGTGLDCTHSDNTDIFLNHFILPPHATSSLIDINLDLDDIFMSDPGTSESFHAWSGGYKYENGELVPNYNPYNQGCYGFWIDLNECFFRLYWDQYPI